jgi:hypothetical protein
MNKHMLEVRVMTTHDGTVDIIQEVQGMDDSYVRLQPEQLDTVIGWLKEAKAELAEGRSLGDEAIEFLAGLNANMLSSDHPDYDRYQELKARIG